jgi:hypothetical protein
MFGGAAAADSDTGAVFGGAAGWQVNPWFGIEGNATWLDRSGSENGFAAAIATHVNLLSRQTAVPFAKAGFGLYHASLRLNDEQAPAFYRQRLQSNDTDPNSRQSFTDPAFVVGGGMDIFLSRHVALRPEAEAMFVLHEGDSRTMGVFTLHLVYHFEDHPITSSRK